MRLKGKNNYIELVKIAFIVLIVIATFPCIIIQITNGCDNSGMYFLNIMSELKMKFGSDCMFTYGPLGFLYHTINLGNNAIYSFIFWFFIIASEIWLLWNVYRCFNKKNDIKRIVLSFLMIISTEAWMQKDYFLCLLFFWAISLAWREQSNTLYLLYAVFLTDVLCLIKFNTGVQCGITLILFVIGKTIFEKKIEKKNVICLIGCGIGYILMFLLYNHSISGLFTYIKTNLEISSGYSSAMSISPDRSTLCWALICLFCYGIAIIIIFLEDKENAYYIFMFSGAIFQTFKHGFVRADGHIYIFFAGFLIIMSVLILFVDLENVRNSKIKKSIIVTLIIMNVIPLFYVDFSIQGIANAYKNKINEIFCEIPNVMKYNIIDSDDDVLPKEFLDIIGENTVTILPSELDIGAYNSINMVVMPSLQLMMAYTPSLDEMNSEFFEGDTAPEYIIYQYDAIDNRVPLLETPETWKKIYENYNAILIKDGYMLLEKMDEPYKIEVSEKVYKMDIDSSSVITVPDDCNYFLKLKTDLTMKGKLMKMLFQIPEVNVNITYSDGTEYSGRILPQMLENGILISELPDSLDTMCNALNGFSTTRKVKEISINGKGWKYYKKTMQVSFQKVINNKKYYDYSSYFQQKSNEISISEADLEYIQGFDTIIIDEMNGNSDSGILRINKNEGIRIRGWAFDKKNEQIAKEVYLQIGEHFFQLHATERADVLESLKLEPYNIKCGFEGWIPLKDWKADDYNLNIIFQNSNNQCYVKKLGIFRLEE